MLVVCNVTKLQSLRGMVDLLPDQTRRWQRVEKIARDQFLRAGFQEIRLPLIEATELFSRGIGETTDVVGKEMYTFLDKGERSCTLRPEGTASVVRAALQHGLLSQGPQRLWYSGPMFRYERPQAGRQRQFHQIGLECLGLSSARSDAEVIALAWSLLKGLGLKGIVLEINTLGSAEDRQKYRKKLVEWLSTHIDELDEDSQKKLQTNPLRILDTKNKATKKLLNEAPTIQSMLSQESELRFTEVQQLLKILEIPFEINHQLVRGLDYYGHTAFEITSDKLGAQATICGGGRYDGLIEQLGGPSTPAIGWAIGMERLMLVLEAIAIDEPNSAASEMAIPTNPELYIVNRGERAEKTALLIATKLRENGLLVELDSSGAPFGKQFKRANKSGATLAMIIGENEIEIGQCRIKHVKRFSDQEIDQALSLEDYESLVKFIRNSISNSSTKS